MLVLDEMNPELIIGSRTMKEFRCSLDFYSNQFWTGKGECSAPPIGMAPSQKPTRLEQCQTTTEAIDNHRSNRSTSEGLKITRSHATRGAQHYPFQARSSHSATQEGQGKAEPELTTQIVQTVDWHLDNDLEEILRLTAPDIEEGPRDRLREIISKYRTSSHSGAQS